MGTIGLGIVKNRAISGGRWRGVVALILPLLCLLLTCRAARAQYVAKDLYSIGFQIFDSSFGQFASGGQVVNADSGFPGSGTIPHVGTPLSPNGVNLSPANFNTYGGALGTNGNKQVGAAELVLSTANPVHAFLWSGTAASAVDLHPTALPAYSSPLATSAAYATTDSQQVGVASSPSNVSHAVIWSGTAASAVDIHPTLPNIDGSVARGTDGVHQVGYGYDHDDSFEHALLWSGTAASAVDLHPDGFGRTHAYGVSGNQQVGEGDGAITGFQRHAMLWTGSANSYVDLAPAGMNSWANGTNGVQQVGAASGIGTIGDIDALVWSGTAASVVDLASFLPAHIFTRSQASTIDAAGNIFGWGLDPSTNSFEALEWSPVPEPAALSVVVFAAAGLLVRGRKSRA